MTISNSSHEKNAHPLDMLIDFAWAAGADLFWVNNAKDELKKLRKTSDCLEISETLHKLEDALNHPVAYARINSSGDLYDLRLQNNPFNDQNTVVPLFKKPL